MPPVRIVVHARGAKDLPDGDFGSKNRTDAYLFVKIGEETRQTKVIDNNNNPVWDAQLVFDVVDGPEVVMQVFDSDAGRDDFLGVHAIPVGFLMENGVVDNVVALVDKKDKPAGGLDIRVECLPLEAAAPAQQQGPFFDFGASKGCQKSARYGQREEPK
eukprot:NODE_1609_length_825_cov_2.228093_g1249_i0.p3 GENE.NODE_1609_length_825_cov_2.228093_g1249_i0~~NODE_1609_length_825_cov_2.228093_g1249_i0.p3  ORF type:complete len:172 (+),score=54.51 NODE_1609_length_825_cov_2.228093_g1249_i0:40-516(+)